MILVPGRTILRIRFGSHLYGTSTPASDVDLKSVHIPQSRDILLGRAKGSISAKRPKAEGERNVAGDVDEETYSLQRYLGLLAEGQTVALDMLFATPAVMLNPPAAEWQEIVANRHRLVTRKSAAFVGYCRQQANKYGIKGSRVAAARAALALLDESVERLGPTAKLIEIAADAQALAARTEHIAIIPVQQVSGQMLDHMDVCGRKLPYSTSIKSGRDIIKRLVDEYGHRALQAESQQGVDWKALSHAVRVASQAIELLNTGAVTFPLPNAAHILAIKTGSLIYQKVADEIERLLAEVEAAAERSSLRREPDHAWIEDFVAETYGRQVRMAA